MVSRPAFIATALSTLAVTASVAAPVTVAHAVSAQPSPTLAGYSVSGTKHLTSASETFVVPTITCKKNESGVGPAVLLGREKTVKKATTTIVTGAGVGVGCENKAPVYQVIIAMNNAQTQEFSLSPGDTVTVTVKVSKAKSKVKVDDKTSKSHKTVTGSGQKKMTFAEFGDQGLAINSQAVGIDPFTKTAFSHALLDGKPIGQEGAYPVERVDTLHNGRVQISVGKLHKDRNFTTTFKHS